MKENHLRDIFNKAVELTGDEQSAFLDNACGGDDALRAEVESLLGHYTTKGTVQDAPAGTNQQGDSVAQQVDTFTEFKRDSWMTEAVEFVTGRGYKVPEDERPQASTPSTQ